MSALNGLVSEAPAPGDVVRVIDTAVEGVALPIVANGGQARAVLWPGNGARFRSLNLIDLDAAGATVDLGHPGDAVYYVIAGAGEVVDVASGATQPLIEGAMVHIDAGDVYRLVAGPEGLHLVGGPCPPDAGLYGEAGAAPAESEI